MERPTADFKGYPDVLPGILLDAIIIHTLQSVRLLQEILKAAVTQKRRSQDKEQQKYQYEA